MAEVKNVCWQCWELKRKEKEKKENNNNDNFYIQSVSQCLEVQ